MEDADNKNVLFEYKYKKYNYRVGSMIYTTNRIEQLNKLFRKTLKVRASLPSAESALVLLTKTSIDMGEGRYNYKISNFKFEPKLLQS